MSSTPSKRKPRKLRNATSKSRAGASHRSVANVGKTDARITESIGNVFRDLGRSEPEARNLTLRSDLMIQISELIRARNLTQARAAKLFKVSQPRISDLIRGKISLFSLESLIGMLTTANIQVRLIVEPTAA